MLFLVENAILLSQCMPIAGSILFSFHCYSYSSDMVGSIVTAVTLLPVDIALDITHLIYYRADFPILRFGLSENIQ